MRHGAMQGRFIYILRDTFEEAGLLPR